MKLFGTRTQFVQPPIDLEDAKTRYAGRFVLLVDPVYERMDVVKGKVMAVSDTEDGVRRLKQSLGPIDVRVRIDRLAD
ncbi:hypothetical protein EON79_20685 [bacterium]|nr:MAG: hypothetical protein EON79_20685 [bacterium]